MEPPSIRILFIPNCGPHPRTQSSCSDQVQTNGCRRPGSRPPRVLDRSPYPPLSLFWSSLDSPQSSFTTLGHTGLSSKNFKFRTRKSIFFFHFDATLKFFCIFHRCTFLPPPTERRSFPPPHPHTRVQTMPHDPQNDTSSTRHFILQLRTLELTPYPGMRR